MRITEVSVAGLFGIFNHTIPLNTDDHITIIYAPNGFGKTIILKMIHGLLRGRYSEVLAVPFESFQIKFDDSSVVWMDKTVYERVNSQGSLFDEPSIDEMQKIETDRSSRIMVNLDRGENSSGTLSFPLSPLYDIRNVRIPISRIDREVPELYRIGTDEWLYVPTGETLYLDDISERFGYLLFDQFDVPDWWTEFQKSIDVHLIGTGRLRIQEGISEPTSYSKRITVFVPTVRQYAKGLSRIIQQKLAESATLSQSLDRTFPTRLITQMKDPAHMDVPADEIRDKLIELDRKRSRLIEVGILDEEEDMELLPVGKMISSAKNVLSVYAQDTEKKLKIFDEIVDKIDLFKRLVNKRFLYKEINISKKEGLTIVTANGEPLPPSSLSSGEQHELILLYELLFEVKSGSLILIDEPEMSLHVAWQRAFLQDIQEIAKLNSLDIVMATHSPQVINNRRDITVSLKPV